MASNITRSARFRVSIRKFQPMSTSPKVSLLLQSILMATVSFATLALELHLTRVLAFVYWNHVVYLIISLALLGYGVASTLISILGHRLDGAGGVRFLCWNAILAPTAVVGLLLWLSQTQMSFRLDDIGASLPHLLLSYLMVTVIFVFCGNIVVYLFLANPAFSSRLYTWDLAAAALACLVFPFSLTTLGGVGALVAVGGVLAIVVTIVMVFSGERLRHPGLTLLALSVALGMTGFGIFAESSLQLTPDTSKSLGYAKNQLINASVRHEHMAWDPVTRLDIVSADRPINIGWSRIQPPTKLITFDGDAISAIAQRNESFPTPAEKRAFAGTNFHMPYLQRTVGGEHLVIGLGGGPDIADSLLLDARRISAVDINGAIIKAMQGPFAAFSGNIFSRPQVEVHYSEGRAFLKQSDRKFDLIRMTGVDTFTALSTGAYVMAENHLYTVEAIQDYFRHLGPDGILCIHRWFYDQKPRETLRLFAVILEALRREGIEHPEHHVAVVRPATSGVTFLSKKPFSPTEAQALVGELERRGAKSVFHPHVEPSNHPASAIFHDYAKAFDAGQQSLFQRDYPYDISPVVDDRPFFFNYYKLSRMFSDRDTGLIQGYWAYFVFAIILALAVGAVVAMIWLPLFLCKREGLRVPFAGVGAAYFACLGLGFIMIEIALMQRLALYLGHPIYSIAVVMGSMLLFAGIGSTLATRVALPRRRVVFAACAVGACCLLFASPALSTAIDATIGLSLPVKAVLSCLLVSPIALCLGAFFPTGLHAVAARQARFVPWAWGINSGFTVIGSVLAVVLAMALGFSMVILLAGAIYMLTPLLFRRLEEQCDYNSAPP